MNILLFIYQETTEQNGVPEKGEIVEVYQLPGIGFIYLGWLPDQVFTSHRKKSVLMDTSLNNFPKQSK